MQIRRRAKNVVRMKSYSNNILIEKLSEKSTQKRIAAFTLLFMMFQVLSPFASLIHKKNIEAATVATMYAWYSDTSTTPKTNSYYTAYTGANSNKVSITLAAKASDTAHSGAYMATKVAFRKLDLNGDGNDTDKSLWCAFGITPGDSPDSTDTKPIYSTYSSYNNDTFCAGITTESFSGVAAPTATANTNLHNKYALSPSGYKGTDLKSKEGTEFKYPTIALAKGKYEWAVKSGEASNPLVTGGSLVNYSNWRAGSYFNVVQADSGRTVSTGTITSKPSVHVVAPAASVEQGTAVSLKAYAEHAPATASQNHKTVVKLEIRQKPDSNQRQTDSKWCNFGSAKSNSPQGGPTSTSYAQPIFPTTPADLTDIFCRSIYVVDSGNSQISTKSGYVTNDGWKDLLAGSTNTYDYANWTESSPATFPSLQLPIGNYGVTAIATDEEGISSDWATESLFSVVTPASAITPTGVTVSVPVTDPVTSTTLTSANPAETTKNQVQLNAVVAGPEGVSQGVDWAVDSTYNDYLSVSSTGLVKALKALPTGSGNVKVYASAKVSPSVSGYLNITLDVPSTDPASVIFSPNSNGTVTAASPTKTYTATAMNGIPEAIDPQPTMVWASSNDAVATVSNGVVTAGTDAGDAEISATVQNTNISWTVRVTNILPDRAPNNIALLTSSGAAAVSRTLTSLSTTYALDAVVRNAENDSTDVSQGIVWASSDPAVASVSDAGLVTPRNNGQVEITAASTVDNNVRNSLVVSVDVASNGGGTPVTSPSCRISASPSSLLLGTSATITYSSTNATSGDIDNGIGALSSIESGTKTVSPTADTTYTMTVINGNESSECSVPVSVVTEYDIKDGDLDQTRNGATISFDSVPTGSGSGFNISVDDVTNTVSAPPSGKKVVVAYGITPTASGLSGISASITLDYPTGTSYIAGDTVMYWNGTSWSSEGITVTGHTSGTITFTTTHFSEFAVLSAATGVDTNGDGVIDENDAGFLPESGTNVLNLLVNMLLAGALLSLMVILSKKNKFAVLFN
jgi:hypothetical protein